MADVANEPIHAQTTTAPPSADVRQPESKRSLRWIILLIVIVLVVGGLLLRHYMSQYESTDDAQVDGEIHAISARVNGYVTEVNVTDNQIVQKGAVLVRIDPKDYEVAVQRARAELADAEATARAMNLGVPVTTVATTTNVSSSQADL